MGKFINFGKNTAKFIWVSLRPILFVAFIFVVSAMILLVYDQYKIYQDREKGAQLVNRILVTPKCDEIVKSGEKVAFELTIKNANIESVVLETLQVSNSLLKTEKNKVANFIGISPNTASGASQTTSFAQYSFQPAVSIESKKSTKIKVEFKALPTAEAGATAHTIVVYNGEVNLLFDHDITIHTSCRYQVRYR